MAKMDFEKILVRLLWIVGGAMFTIYLVNNSAWFAQVVRPRQIGS